MTVLKGSDRDDGSGTKDQRRETRFTPTLQP